MNLLLGRGRVWTLLAIGVAMIVLVTWTFQWFGLSWTTIVVAAIGAGCIAAMVYLWWVSARTARTLDDPRIARHLTKPKTRQP